MERLLAVFSRRTAPSTSAATASTDLSAPAWGPTSAASGQGARCTEPSCHQLQTSSVTKGRNGAKRRWRAERASASVARAESVPPGVGFAVGARLDQLDVVVAEGPEEGLGDLERPGVVEAVVGGRGRVDRARRAAPAAPRRAARAPRRSPVSGPRPAGPARTSTRSRTLIARRRPIFMTPMSSAVSVPGRPLQAQ